MRRTAISPLGESALREKKRLCHFQEPRSPIISARRKRTRRAFCGAERSGARLFARMTSSPKWLPCRSSFSLANSAHRAEQRAESVLSSFGRSRARERRPVASRTRGTGPALAYADEGPRREASGPDTPHVLETNINISREERERASSPESEQGRTRQTRGGGE